MSREGNWTHIESTLDKGRDSGKMANKKAKPTSAPGKAGKTRKDKDNSKVMPLAECDHPELEPTNDEDEAPLGKRLGQVMRQHRLHNHLTLADVAGGAGISSAMLSRIETGAATASFDTLTRLVKTLGITFSTLFRELEVPQGRAQHIKARDTMEVVRSGTRKGYVYRLLAFNQGPHKLFDPFLITMDHESEVYPRFEHPGIEFMYILEGKMEYRHGNQLYMLEPGDTLTFPEHGPEKLFNDQVTFLDVIVYGDGKPG